MNHENSTQSSEFNVAAKALADGLLQAPGTRVGARRMAAAMLACLALLAAGCGTLSPDDDEDYDEAVAGSDMRDARDRDEGHFD